MTPSSGESDLGVLRHYWRVYGGFTGLVKSWYFAAAFVANCIAHNMWSAPGWWDLPIAVLPNMLGFSLAGFAIFLGFGSDGFRKFLVQAKVGEGSAFVAVTTSFMHFVIVQILALTLAIFSKTIFSVVIQLPERLACLNESAALILWFLGLLFFFYSITASLASVVGIFRMVRLFDRYMQAGGE